MKRISPYTIPIKITRDIALKIISYIPFSRLSLKVELDLCNLLSYSKEPLGKTLRDTMDNALWLILRIT